MKFTLNKSWVNCFQIEVCLFSPIRMYCNVSVQVYQYHEYIVSDARREMQIIHLREVMVGVIKEHRWHNFNRMPPASFPRFKDSLFFINKLIK